MPVCAPCIGIGVTSAQPSNVAECLVLPFVRSLGVLLSMSRNKGTMETLMRRDPLEDIGDLLGSIHRFTT